MLSFLKNPDTDRYDIYLVFFFTMALAIPLTYIFVYVVGNSSIILGLRLGLLIFGLAYLFINKIKANYPFNLSTYHFVWVYVLLLYLTSLFSPTFSKSLKNTTTLALSILFIAAFVQYIVQKYGPAFVRWFFVRSFLYIYGVSVVLFYLFEPFGRGDITNLYGEGQALTSNLYGWSAAIHFLLLMDYRVNYKNATFPIRVLAIMVLDTFVFFVTGARIALLVVGFGFALFILYQKNIGPNFKALFLIIGFTLILYILLVPDNPLMSSFSYREEVETIRKESDQIGDKAERIIIIEKYYELCRQHPETMLYGTGLNNLKEGLGHYVDLSQLYVDAPHNSYLRIMLDNGLVVFGFALYFFFMPGLAYYFFRDRFHFISIPAYFIISLTETNYGPGQFLFLPWIAYTLFYAILAANPDLDDFHKPHIHQVYGA